jgi:hypothetical protein
MNERVACEPLSADEAQRHMANGRALFAMVEDVRPLADGWALRLPDAPDVRDRLTAFLELNRRCCTHIRHAVVFEPIHGPMWLELSGGGESGKVAIASELVALLPSGLVPSGHSDYPEWLAEVDAIARRELNIHIAQVVPQLAPAVSPFAEFLNGTTPAAFVERHLRTLAGA